MTVVSRLSFALCVCGHTGRRHDDDETELCAGRCTAAGCDCLLMEPLPAASPTDEPTPAPVIPITPPAPVAASWPPGDDGSELRAPAGPTPETSPAARIAALPRAPQHPQSPEPAPTPPVVIQSVPALSVITRAARSDSPAIRRLGDTAAQNLADLLGLLELEERAALAPSATVRRRRDQPIPCPHCPPGSPEPIGPQGLASHIRSAHREVERG